MTAKSPLTGIFGDGSGGGHFAPELKFAGYDGVFFTGISPKPVYLLIDEDKAELKDASALWGKDAYETEDALEENNHCRAERASDLRLCWSCGIHCPPGRPVPSLSTTFPFRTAVVAWANAPDTSRAETASHAATSRWVFMTTLRTSSGPGQAVAVFRFAAVGERENPDSPSGAS